MLIVLFLSLPGKSADFLELERVGESAAEDPGEAKKEILQSVIGQASEEQAKLLLGEKRYTENEDLIKSKVFQNSGKYVVFFKTRGLKKTPEGFQQEIFLKISLESLQAMLLELGILYDQKARPVVLHFLRLTDRSKSQSFRWWTENSTETQSSLVSYALETERTLSEELRKSGAYLLPVVEKEQKSLIPQVLQKKVLSERDMEVIASLLKANAILVGDINLIGENSLVETPQVTLFFSMKNLSNNRTIAELSRKYEVSAAKKSDENSGFQQERLGNSMAEAFPGLVKSTGADLKQQVQKAWQKGIFGSSLLHLVIQGDVSYRTLKKVKEGLKRNVRLVKGVRERLFEPGQTHFEVDVTGAMESLVDYFGTMEIEGVRLKLVEASSSKMILRLQESKEVL